MSQVIDKHGRVVLPESEPRTYSAPIKNRKDLVLETIELERTSMVYKKGLHLAREAMKEMVNPGSKLSADRLSVFNEYLVKNGLTKI